MFLRTPVHDSRPKEMSLVVIGTITVMDRKRALHELMNIDIIRIPKGIKRTQLKMPIFTA